MRKTKIICTMGPSTDKEGILEQLMEAGMNVARFNFSHGDYDEHRNRMNHLKEIRKAAGTTVAILLDTKGPEIRLGTFQNKEAFLEAGDLFRLYNEDVEGDQNGASVSYKRLYEDVTPGTAILFDDGLIETHVESIEGKDIICRIINGGRIADRKGVNVPNVNLNMPYMSKKDREDILFGISQDVDFVAASFVRSAKDVREVRSLLDDNGGSSINIISKIENMQGVENIDEIIEASDGIMIARGDMGVELPCEDVPVIQKMIIKKVYQAGEQVITATQMLDSMMQNPRPTRAEATDVANAVYDGTSAIMLSGETAAGKYPVEALKTMIRIAVRTEEDIDYRKRFFNYDRRVNPDVTDAICHATCTTSHDLNAKAIVTVTKSGRSARMISRYRPECDIIAFSTEKQVCRQLSLSWGVTPRIITEEKDVLNLFTKAVKLAKTDGYLETGDIVVITSGVPLGKSGTTNMIKVQVVE